MSQVEYLSIMRHPVLAQCRLAREGPSSSPAAAPLFRAFLVKIGRRHMKGGRRKEAAGGIERGQISILLGNLQSKTRGHVDPSKYRGGLKDSGFREYEVKKLRSAACSRQETQFFPLIFTEPRAHHKVHPCTHNVISGMLFDAFEERREVHEGDKTQRRGREEPVAASIHRLSASHRKKRQ